MLNFDVKRKINTLRDILVGKVPDPKAQVEQITIALIYKFMDDMDMEGKEFGGKRVFFIDSYEKYAFSQLMQSENSAQQRLNLYTEGIIKMSENAHLPQLFRDIFRGAFLPYRDPETLNMFLKEIADFTYSDSEDLGNAFEYLLSIMGSQGDAGQFRTPRHIIDMMVEITMPQKNETVLDPACGTAGFLISAYKYIVAHNRDSKGNSTLNANDKICMIANFAGYDISPDMVRLSRVNMYLHGFIKPQISEYDTLTSLDKWDNTYDVIFANPPFMTPKGGIIPHNRYRISAKRSEVLFVDYIAEHLNPTGRAAIIVPEGIVFQSANAYKNLRKFLVDDGLLYAVISLPAGVFNPYSGVKTCILLLNKTLSMQRDSILFVKMNNDGYDLGAQRRENGGSEIPEVIKITKNYQNGLSIEGWRNASIAKKNEIALQDYILAGDRYAPIVVINGKWPMVQLREVCEFLRGLTYNKDDESSTETRNAVLRASNIDLPNNALNLDELKYLTDAVSYSDSKRVKYNDILICASSGSKQHLGKVAVIPQNITHFFGGFMGVLRSNDSILPQFLYRCTTTREFREYINSLISGVNINNIRGNELLDFMIPLPPRSVQSEIVAELQVNQRIIDAAKQIVDNYQPTIVIDPSWNVAKLGVVCLELRNGVNVEQLDNEGKYRVTRIQTISDGTVDMSKTKWTNDEPTENYFMKAGDILLSHINSFEHLAKVAIFPEIGERVVHGINLIRCRLNTNVIVPEYAISYMKSKQFVDDARKFAQRAVNQASIKTTDLRQLDIPLPHIEKQREIVARIREEMTIVEQNKRLIEIFQQKIKDKMSEVWGK